jgi:hypothetical protein
MAKVTLTNKDIEGLLKNGSRLIVVNDYEDDIFKFYIGKETSKNKITQQQFDEYMVLCDNSDTSEKIPNWKIGKTYRCYYWL